MFVPKLVLDRIALEHRVKDSLTVLCWGLPDDTVMLMVDVETLVDGPATTVVRATPPKGTKFWEN